MIARPVAVCVPARNEAELLPRLVRSLSRQTGFSAGSPLRLVVAANNCTDATVPVLHALEAELRGGTLAFEIVEARLAAAEAHVGFARRLAMDRGSDWLERDGAGDGILITTDADAVAPPGWVAANVRALEDAEVVGGRLVIERDPDGAAAAALDRRIERYWALVRALEEAIDPPPHDPMPRHGDHTAASLALGVGLYRKVQGLPTLACGEDNALVARIRCLGGRVRHSPDVEIVVSARIAGRVEGGMASEMGRRAALGASGGAYELPPAGYWRRLLERRAALRRAWVDGSAAAMESLGLGPEDLDAISIATCPNDIAFVERAMLRESQAIDPMPALDLERATAGLDDLVRAYADQRGRVSA